MKSIVFFALTLILFSCAKQQGLLQAPSLVCDTLKPIPINLCLLNDSSSVSYTRVVKKIFDNNCMPCHAKPGSGGINLDTYDQCKATAQSGQLIPIVVYSPGNTFMPPPPQKPLDSCEIKALNLWIKQGCLLN